MTENKRSWIEEQLELKGQMIDVFFISRTGEITSEAHVNDPITLAETIAMSMDRTGARYAVYPDGQFWALTGGGKTRHFPNREAAEMVAIHRV